MGHCRGMLTPSILCKVNVLNSHCGWYFPQEKNVDPLAKNTNVSINSSSPGTKKKKLLVYWKGLRSSLPFSLVVIHLRMSLSHLELQIQLSTPVSAPTPFFFKKLVHLLYFLASTAILLLSSICIFFTCKMFYNI